MGIPPLLGRLPVLLEPACFDVRIFCSKQYCVHNKYILRLSGSSAVCNKLGAEFLGVLPHPVPESTITIRLKHCDIHHLDPRKENHSTSTVSTRALVCPSIHLQMEISPNIRAQSRLWATLLPDHLPQHSLLGLVTVARRHATLEGAPGAHNR